MHRFYISPDHWNLESLSLRGEEAHHCTDVVRCKVGDRVVVFDGRGNEATTEIMDTASGTVTLKTHFSLKTERPPAAITLCQAVPKGKNMDIIVQKATELGVSRIVPLLSERTVVRLEESESKKKREKWQRVALEACKQCGQNWLPEVAEPVPVDRFLARTPRAANEECLWLIAALNADAQPLKAVLSEYLELNGSNLPKAATILIGPEGDFTPAELSEAVNVGYRPLSLGPIVLRSETAAIYALSVLSHELM